MGLGVNTFDVAMLVNLALSTNEATKRTCEEHDALAKAISDLHLTLKYLQSEIADPHSVINTHTGGRRKDLETHISGCGMHLKRISSVLTRHGKHESKNRSMRNDIHFGIAGVKVVSESQLMITYATVITLTLNLLSLGTKGKVEKELSKLRGGAKELRVSINMLLAKQTAIARGGTGHEYLLSAAHGQRDMWRSIKRGLVKEGVNSNVVHAHKNLIQAYFQELVNRGLLDEAYSVRSTTNSSEMVDLVEPDTIEANSNYRQPAVEDSDSISIDDSSTKSSTKESTNESPQSESQQPVSALPDRDRDTDLASLDDHGKTAFLTEDPARGSDLGATPAPLQVYEQPATGHRNALQMTDLPDTIPRSKEFNRQRRVPLQTIDSNIKIPVFQTRGPPEFVNFQLSQTQNSGIWDESATETPLPERCECYECMAAPTATINPLTSYGWQQEHSERLQDASRPKRRAPSTRYHESQNGSSKGNYSPPAPKEQKKAPLLSLLLFPRMRKATNTATAFVELPQKVPQPRKRQKRAPRPTPPPRPVSPTPPPPEWWLEERLRRRPPGFERGRSPTPRDAEDPVYSRGINVYSDVLYNGWNTFSYNS